MAQMVLSFAGGAVGTYFGGPIGGAIGSAAGAYLGGLIDNALGIGQQSPKTPAITDNRTMDSTYGKPRPRVWGTVRIGTEVLWAHPITLQTQANGGGKSGVSQTSVTYYGSMACAICEGPITGVLRVWADKKLIRDWRPTNRNVHSRAKNIFPYLGTETQMPNGAIQVQRGHVYVPAFRGTAYLMIEHMYLNDFANHYPQIEVEVAGTGTNAYPIVSVGTWTSVSAAFAIIDPNNGFYYAFGDPYNVAKIDLSTNQIQQTNPSAGIGAGSGSNPVLGSIDNSIYIGSAFDRQLYKLDGDTLNRVASSTHGGIGDPPAIGWLKCRNGYVVGGDNSHGVSAWAESPLLADGTLLDPSLIREVYETFAQPVDAVDLDTPTGGLGGTQFNIWGVKRTGTGVFKLYQFQVTDPQTYTIGEGVAAGTCVLLNTFDISSSFPSLAADSTSSGAITYAPSFNQLLIAFGNYAIKWDIATSTTVGAEIHNALVIGGTGSKAAWTNFIDDSVFVENVANHAIVTDIFSWTIQNDFDMSLWGVGSAGALLYNPNADSIVSGNIQIYLNRISDAGVSLDTVVRDICEWGGLQSSQIDVSDLTTTFIRGYAVSRGSTPAAALQPLMETYFFDAVESDYKIKFVRRGGSSVATITKDDMGAYDHNSQHVDPLVITDAQEETLPRRSIVSYIDRGMNYQTNYQDYKRVSTLTKAFNESRADLGVVLLPDEAKGVAEKALVSAWTKARTFKFPTSRKFIKLDPADPVTLSKDGNTWSARITKADLGVNGVIDFEAEQEDSGIYTAPNPIGSGANLTGDAVGDIGADDGGAITDLPVASTMLRLMDINAIRDADNNAGFYAAMAKASFASRWNGANLDRSSDGGTTYGSIASVTAAQNACIGYATTALSAPRAYTVWDRVNTVTVVPLSNSAAVASAASEAAVLNGANYCLIGSEILGFATAVDNGDGSFTLSNLIRGRRGTSDFVGTHHAGSDIFVMLNESILVDRSEVNSFIGAVRQYRADSIGTTAVGSTYNFQDTGNRLKPYPVCSISGSRDISSNLTINWIRQTRIGGDDDWLDAVTDVPLSEAAEAYQIDIIHSGSVVRTISATTNTASYSAANQTTDFGSPQASIAIRIYQMSAVVGRGYEADATV